MFIRSFARLLVRYFVVSFVVSSVVSFVGSSVNSVTLNVSQVTLFLPVHICGQRCFLSCPLSNVLLTPTTPRSTSPLLLCSCALCTPITRVRPPYVTVEDPTIPYRPVLPITCVAGHVPRAHPQSCTPWCPSTSAYPYLIRYGEPPGIPWICPAL